MDNQLQKRLKQSSFSSVFQEATLSILVSADYFNKQLELVCEQQGITATQYNVLRILHGVYPDGHARCDIITRMVNAAPDVTRLIDRLVAAGLAKRTKSNEDARLSITVITKRGIGMLDSILPEIEKLERHLSSKLSEKDARQLTTLCANIYGE